MSWRRTSRFGQDRVCRKFDDLSIVPDSSVNPAEEELQVRRAFQHVLASRGVGLACSWTRECGRRGQLLHLERKFCRHNLLKLTCQEFRDPIVDSGLISQSEFDAEMKRVDEHDFLMPSPMMWTVWGQVPVYARWLSTSGSSDR
jgi:hypothetical protein